jgi:hypothetical protein
MTDSELLELAANAIGTNFVPAESWDDGAGWNPLEDDGDALRLAVKLRIDHEYEGETVVVWFEAPRPGWDNGQVWSWTEPLGDDPCVSVRRAIVRAAAEMAKPKTPNVELTGPL